MNLGPDEIIYYENQIDDNLYFIIKGNVNFTIDVKTKKSNKNQSYMILESKVYFLLSFYLVYKNLKK